VEYFARRTLALPWAIFLAALSLMGAATVDRDLEGIKKKIANEKKGLSQLQIKEGSVLQSLGQIESELDKRTKELKLANAKLSSIASELAIKQGQAERLNYSIASRLEIFQKRAAALYRWQKSASPLVILNGDVSLGNFLQRRRYLKAAVAFDRELLTRLDEESRRQEILRQELAQKKQELDDQKNSLGIAKEAIRREAEKKRILLASLRRDKETRLRALKEMEAAAQRLEKMLEAISRRAVVKPRGAPAAPSTGSGLEAMRGRLEWPVKGLVTAPFGKFKHPEFAAEIIRNGIDIDAPMGEEIKAVETGRIVYADRFSGYGRMVILDHGERYFTIYGYLSEISKKSGDEIRRGEVLGRVGDSAALAGSKLYFEMRKDGRSVDPVPWFKK
jgi:septal ring factor EnvC (AmiA/AmiB activator)